MATARNSSFVEASVYRASQSNGVLKLHAGDKPSRRVSIDCLLGNEGNLSFDKLMKLTTMHITSSSEIVDVENFSKTWTIQMYYYNNENSWKLVSCDAELAEAFQQAQSSPTQPVRTIRNPFSKCVVAISDGSRIPVLTCKAVLMEKQLFYKPPSAPGANGYIPASVKRSNIRNAPRRNLTTNSSAKRAAKRWTSTPANNRRHLQNAARSLATGISAATEKIRVKLAAAAKYHISEEDREKILKLLDNINDVVVERAAVMERNLYDAVVKVRSEGQDSFNLASFNSTFVHARHVCDGCKVSPIIGVRYHATNICNFDICEKCVGNYDKCGIKLLPEQLACDAHFQVSTHLKCGVPVCDTTEHVMPCQEKTGNSESDAISGFECNQSTPGVVDISQERVCGSTEIEDGSQYPKGIMNTDVSATSDEDVAVAHKRESEELKQSMAVMQCQEEDTKVDDIMISDFDFSPSMPEVVTLAPKKGKECTPRVAPKKLIGEVGVNLERCVLALGGAVHDAVEGGIKFSHKTRDQAVVIAAAVAAVAGTKNSTDQHNCVEDIFPEESKPSTFCFAEDRKKLATALAEERRKLLITHAEESEKNTSALAQESLRTVTATPFTRKEILNRVMSSLSKICNPTKPSTNQVVVTSCHGTHFPLDGSQKAPFEDANSGQISDVDFQQFLSWWSPSEKVGVSSKQLEAKHEDSETEITAPSYVAKNGELSDELLAHFFSLCSSTLKPRAPIKQKDRNDLKVSTTSNNSDNGQLSDEDFNHFISVWSTCEKRALLSKGVKTDTVSPKSDDGTMSDDDFLHFLCWWSTTKKAIDSLVVSRSSSKTLPDTDSLSFRSVEIASCDIHSASSNPCADPEMSSEGMELELEDGTIVISPCFGGYIEVEGNEEWDFIDAAAEETEMLGQAAVTIGSSLFQEDLTRSTEALSEPTIIISNASDVALPKTTSRVSLDSSLSLVSAASSELDDSDMSFVSSGDSLDSWSSVNSA